MFLQRWNANNDTANAGASNLWPGKSLLERAYSQPHDLDDSYLNSYEVLQAGGSIAFNGCSIKKFIKVTSEFICHFQAGRILIYRSTDEYNTSIKHFNLNRLAMLKVLDKVSSYMLLRSNCKLVWRCQCFRANKKMSTNTILWQLAQFYTCLTIFRKKNRERILTVFSISLIKSDKICQQCLEILT